MMFHRRSTFYTSGCITSFVFIPVVTSLIRVPPLSPSILHDSVQCSSEWNWLPTKINNAGWYIFHRSNNQLILRISVYPQLSRYGRAVRNHWSINEIIHRLCADAQWYKVSSVHCWYSAWVRVFFCLRVRRYVATRDAAQEEGEIRAKAGMRWGAVWAPQGACNTCTPGGNGGETNRLITATPSSSCQFLKRAEW